MSFSNPKAAKPRNRNSKPAQKSQATIKTLKESSVIYQVLSTDDEDKKKVLLGADVPALDKFKPLQVEAMTVSRNAVILLWQWTGTARMPNRDAKKLISPLSCWDQVRKALCNKTASQSASDVLKTIDQETWKSVCNLSSLREQ
eukprot:g29909.t1